jgi:hypothetical protein
MSMAGRWRIVEMDLWEQEVLDLVGPAFVELTPQQTGSPGFIAVEGSVDWRPVRRDGRPGAEFTWDGFDDDDPASGRGWAVLEEDESLRGHIYLHLGDDSGFKAVRAGDELGRRR